MVDWPLFMGGILVVLLVTYSLTGGADYGAGLWDLLARGPRAGSQRALIARAIGPIWEANHVWLIAIIVVYFLAFPRAFATMSKVLHIPLTIFLMGVVLRGTAFVFRTYDRAATYARWSRVFALSSLIAPLMLGVCLGTLSNGGVVLDHGGRPTAAAFRAWLDPFAWITGLLALVLFAFLSAVYLANQADEPGLREDFRKRGFWAGVAVGVVALLGLIIAGEHAPVIQHGLRKGPWAPPLHLLTGLAATGALWGLWHGHLRLARFLAAAQVTGIVLGWAFSQFPYLIFPAFTIRQAAAEPAVLRLTAWIFLIGSCLITPSFIYLYRVFSFGKPGSVKAAAHTPTDKAQKS